jgi:hypothetical protein
MLKLSDQVLVFEECLHCEHNPILQSYREKNTHIFYQALLSLLTSYGVSRSV